jgi:glutamyl-tRNA reductase
MSTGILAAGLSHKTAPIGLLERLAVPDERLPKALHQLLTYEHVFEGVVLSTCNRIEVYAAASRFHGGAQDLRNFFAEFCHVAPEDFVDHLYTYHEEGAVEHLFRVASGIDSMIVGESEILGQVKRAYQVALDEQAAGRFLGRAFRQALTVGKRARTETSISRNPASISSAAVALARGVLGSDEGSSLEGKSVAVVGAGEMGKLAVRALANAGATGVTIVNRSEARGQSLADRFGARARPLSELASVLLEADILICSTNSPQTIVDRPLVSSAMQSRAPGSPLLIVDIAVPRDVDPAAGELDGVELRDIDDLRTVVETSLGSRQREVARVEEIISRELDRFGDWERASEIAPLLSALMDRAEVIRAAEVERLSGGRGLSESERETLDRITRRTVAKLLHEPLEKARSLAGSERGRVYLSALRELFGLDDEPDA